ncbi:endonuclease/exonuclease/phosphatase family metal-dependent hydrolase [Thermocatellispora tengchongensis]|uniref:Endonuclease/exonuclease/phosphatase family metal-dependent hydrolase n=1 Tax=Thermocatellispora tengchongensis TaxID=1073253 RepID=A0A840P6E6_9ACTN|nr:endonuclease/exonuclease/phosphatase family protein [Thermocatellispora tengchongensis]MBB5134569.1 endonuclease/exonuclease/phosphatase family metal-dependent hydrolase [Thermocatellispora tengchongensis]
MTGTSVTSVTPRPGASRRAARARRRLRPVPGAAAAWLVFTGLHLALSGRVWWWQIPELVPPFAFAVVPVLLLAAALVTRRARRVTAVVALACLILGGGASGINLAALWHRPAPAPPDAITVFSWNTWYWDQRWEGGMPRPPATGTPPRDAGDFYRFLREQDADVLLLQEYVYFGPGSRPIRVDDLARLRREFPGHHIAVASELVTLSRFPIVLQRGIDLRPWAEEERDRAVPPGSSMPDFHTVKTLRTDLRVGGRTVSFYNTHINSPVDSAYRGLDPRRLSPEQHRLRRANLRALAADAGANPHPAVLAGDFNASPAMGILRLLPDRMRDAAPALGSLYPATWNDRRPWWRIDWAFATPEVTVHEYELVRSGGMSDHSGQRLVISVRR